MLEIKHIVVAMTSAALLAACSTTSGGSKERRAWSRVDGQIISDNPALLEIAQTDLTQCHTEAAGRSSIEPCMRARGYQLKTMTPSDPVTSLSVSTPPSTPGE